ncbi:MAG: hypothetical protein A3F41_01340 [Coxiella sp. RIFCSPHIGHO2_12_FULL_44_14]|nr:MAG: hypothetical protein A3F41_01340 [Coxiella sp. RIFCSPHIGHO2_12_FULL_44_14]
MAMIGYVGVKIIHIVSAALLMGAVLGSIAYPVWSYYRKDLTIILYSNQYAVYADNVMAVMGLLQLITGFMLIGIHSILLSSSQWMVIGLGYGLAGFCGLSAMYWQIRCRDKAIAIKAGKGLLKEYRYCLLVKCLFSLVMLISLVVIIECMTRIAK